MVFGVGATCHFICRTFLGGRTKSLLGIQYVPSKCLQNFLDLHFLVIDIRLSLKFILVVKSFGCCQDPGIFDMKNAFIYFTEFLVNTYYNVLMQLFTCLPPSPVHEVLRAGIAVIHLHTPSFGHSAFPY